MRTVVDGVDPGAGSRQIRRHSAMHGLQLLDGQETFCDAALVADNNDQQTGILQQGYGFHNAWEDMQFFPVRNVLSFGGFSVDDSVTV